MSTDLSDRLRALVDAAPPVTAAEAIARAETCPGTFDEADQRRPRRLVRPVAVAASALVLAGAGAGWVVTSGTSAPAGNHAQVVPTHRPKTILTAAEVRTIAAHSSAASASSGAAEVTETSTQDGVAQDGDDDAVTFSGSNIDEKITSVPEPPGSAKSFTTDDRMVDGQFYIYTPGPGDVLEWLHDTNSAGDVASMQFPDPRTLYGAITPRAQFQVDGTTTMNGETVTELTAEDPSAIDPATLGNLATGASLTSFEIWVDANDVVQQIALSTSATDQACRLGPLSAAEKKDLLREYGTTLPGSKRKVVRMPTSALRKELGTDERCGPMTTVTDVTVAFANLGAPESITAPQDAVDYQGKG